MTLARRVLSESAANAAEMKIKKIAENLIGPSNINIRPEL